MLTRIYMKWVPLLVVSGGTGISAELAAAFAVIVFLSNRQDQLINYKFSGDDWVTGQSKPFFNFFASGDLAGKITPKFAKLSRKFKNTGKLLSSTKIH